jgi:hypothetical protein
VKKDMKICLDKCEKKTDFLAWWVAGMWSYNVKHETHVEPNPSDYVRENCYECPYELEHTVSCGIVRLKQEVCKSCYESGKMSWEWRDDWDKLHDKQVRCPFIFNDSKKECWAVLNEKPPKWCPHAKEHTESSDLQEVQQTQQSDSGIDSGGV